MGPFLPAARTRDASQSQQPNDRVDDRTDLSFEIVRLLVITFYEYRLWISVEHFQLFFMTVLIYGDCSKGGV